MYGLYYLIQEAKSQNSESVQEIVDRFDPKIKNTSKFTEGNERQDLEQELRIRIVKSVDKFETRGTPGFREFIHNLLE